MTTNNRKPSRLKVSEYNTLIRELIKIIKDLHKDNRELRKRIQWDIEEIHNPIVTKLVERIK